jgi:hypothetical protein
LGFVDGKDKLVKYQIKGRYKKFRNWRQLSILAVVGFLLILGCSPPENILKPQVSDRITLVRTDFENDTALIKFENIEIKIFGRWNPDGSVNLNFDVQNNSDKAFRFDPQIFRLEDETGQKAKSNGISEIVQVTLIGNNGSGNLTQERSTNTNKPITYQPKQHRKVMGYFQFVTESKSKFDSGKKVKLVFPDLVQPDKEIEIWFECVYD